MAVPRVVVAFDIGSDFGWAILAGGGLVRAGTERLPRDKGSDRGHYRERWVAARDLVERVLQDALELADHFPDEIAVAYERLTWVAGKPAFAAIYYALKAMIEELTKRLGIDLCLAYYRRSGK